MVVIFHLFIPSREQEVYFFVISIFDEKIDSGAVEKDPNSGEKIRSELTKFPHLRKGNP